MRRNWWVIPLVLVCCASAGHGADVVLPRHLQLALWYDGPAEQLAPLEAVITAFEKQHPDVQIHLNPHPTLKAYALLSAWGGKDRDNAPDLVVINSNWLAQFAAQLAPLDELDRTSAASKILPPALDLLRVRGSLRAVPWCLGARCLLARSDLLAERHLPTPADWQQIAILTAPRLHRPAQTPQSPPGVWGIGLPGFATGGGAVLLEEMFWAEGEALIEAHGGVDLTTPGKVKALERFCELAHASEPEVLNWSQPELETAFGEGRVGLLVSDTWAAKAGQKVKDAPKYVALPLPGSKAPVADLLGDGLAVCATSKYQADALEFAKFLLSAEAQKGLVAWGGLPVHQDLQAEARQDPVIGGLMAGLEKAQGGGANAPPAALQALDYAIYLAVSGKQTPAQALHRAQQMLAASMSVTPGAPPG